MEFPDGITEEMTADEALAFTVAFLDTTPDDHTLCMAALTIGEPLVDWHWRVLEAQLVALAADRAGFRKMVSCCDFDESVPEQLQDRLDGFVGPGEDVGHRPGAMPDDLPPKGLRLVAPELARLLDDSSPDAVVEVLRVACATAVEVSGLASPNATAGLAWLAGDELPDTPRDQLIKRLRDESDRLQLAAMPVLGGPAEGEERSLWFRQARALEALAYALDSSVPDFSARAVFSAGFATASDRNDRDEFWRRLAAGEHGLG